MFCYLVLIHNKYDYDLSCNMFIEYLGLKQPICLIGECLYCKTNVQ